MAFAFLMLIAGQGPMPTPASEALAALADASRLDPETAKQTRYLTCYNVPAKDRPAFLASLAVHCNNLSREGELVSPRMVSPTLVAICLDDYGWPGTVYGALNENEPYWHVRVKVHGSETKTAIAPWLPKEAAMLSEKTGSIVPILRADWFVFKTSDPLVYYSFIGLGNKLADLERAVGLDRKLIEEKRKDLAAVVAKSTVTVHARGIFRLQSAFGAWYESRDVRDPTGKGNALRNLDKDYIPVAFEFYVTAPNGLWWKALANDKGDLIGEAPPDIASDSTSRTTDRRVLVSRCDRCHLGNLRLPDDHFRKNFSGNFGIGIGVPVDREKAKRLRGLYFGPILEEIAADNARVIAAMKRLGTTPTEYAKTYGDILGNYEDFPTQEAVATEFGLTKEAMVSRLKIYIQRVGLTDLGLAPFVSGEGITRSLVEEMWPVLAEILYVVGPA